MPLKLLTTHSSLLIACVCRLAFGAKNKGKAGAVAKWIILQQLRLFALFFSLLQQDTANGFFRQEIGFRQGGDLFSGLCLQKNRTVAGCGLPFAVGSLSPGQAVFLFAGNVKLCPVNILLQLV